MRHTRPLLLDLFCSAGGAGEGYARAGFRVVGCDLNTKRLRHNPHESYEGDALDCLNILLAGDTWHGFILADFTAIHASPPCQAYSQLETMTRGEYPRLVGIVRDLLIQTGKPWIIENVVGAPMEQGVLICGTALGIPVRRHRLFDSSHMLYPPGACHHTLDDINVYGHNAWNYHKRSPEYAHWTRATANQCPVSATVARTAMGCEWMNLDELSQAIPPVYTEWLGGQLLRAITASNGKERSA